uniref:Uncharacterized protein n=1 Tax=Glossina brevipalpis TaxID=37001 RepID=A0A1A9WZP2_9MUSC
MLLNFKANDDRTMTKECKKSKNLSTRAHTNKRITVGVVVVVISLYRCTLSCYSCDLHSRCTVEPF